MNTQEKLNLLVNLRAQLDVMRIDYVTKIAAIIPDEIKAQLAEAEATYAENQAACSDAIRSLEVRILAEVLERGETVKATGIMAVWNKGRETWDGKSLTGYAAAHPEILAFKKVGEPTVTIR